MREFRRWSEHDIKLLKTYCSMGIKVVKEKLPERSEQAIRTKCTYMGLSLGNVYEVRERFYMVV